MKNVFYLIMIFFLTISSAHAQYSRNNITVGIGPAMLYGDNAGHYRQFKFKVTPAFSLSYIREITDEFDIRATAGLQLMESGEFGVTDFSVEKLSAIENQAINFTGQAFYFDVMPVYHFNPAPQGYVSYAIDYYAGIGLGILYSNRQDQVPIHREQFTEPQSIEEVANQSFAAYIPIRAGVSSNFEGTWDVGVEGTLITAFPSNVDGNTIKNKIIPLDMLLQFQITIKYNLGR